MAHGSDGGHTRDGKDARTRGLEDQETYSRKREKSVLRSLGLHAGVEDAEAQVGEGPGDGAAYIPEPDITRLGRLAHDVRVDVRVLSNVMEHVHAMPPAQQAAALDALSTSPEAPGEHVRHRHTPSPVAHVDAAGARFGYRATGSGAPLLLIMGFGGVMAAWDPALVAGLAHGHRVTMFDNRGMGTSADAPLNELTIASMAEDARAVLDALGLAKVSVLGWSMGGYIAQELAIRHPDRVDRLVLAATDAGGLDTLGTGPPGEAVLAGEDVSQEDLVRVCFPDDPDANAAAQAWIARVAAEPAMSQTWFRAPRETLAEQARAELAFARDDEQAVAERLARIIVPTLVIAGAEDAIVPVQMSRALADGIADALTRVYEGAGHGFLFQRPQAVATDILTFLGGRLTP